MADRSLIFCVGIQKTAFTAFPAVWVRSAKKGFCKYLRYGILRSTFSKVPFHTRFTRIERMNPMLEIALR
jgi:hypothetical protein